MCHKTKPNETNPTKSDFFCIFFNNKLVLIYYLPSKPGYCILFFNNPDLFVSQNY